MNLQLAANHRVASCQPSCPKAELRRMTDREISQMIELWREEECLWKVTSKSFADVYAKKAALARISQQMDGMDVGKTLFMIYRVVYKPV